MNPKGTKSGDELKAADETVRSWLLREGTLNGKLVSEDELANIIGLEETKLTQAIRRVKRAVLAEFGFSDPNAIKGRDLTEAEKRSWLHAKSLAGADRQLAEFEITQHNLAQGPTDPKLLKDLWQAATATRRQRDQLLAKLGHEAIQVLKVEAKAGGADGGGLQVTVHAGPLGPEWMQVMPAGGGLPPQLAAEVAAIEAAEAKGGK